MGFNFIKEEERTSVVLTETQIRYIRRLVEKEQDTHPKDTNWYAFYDELSDMFTEKLMELRTPKRKKKVVWYIDVNGEFEVDADTSDEEIFEECRERADMYDSLNGLHNEVNFRIVDEEEQE